MNDGRGNFQRAIGALPDIFENGGTVAVGDFTAMGIPTVRRQSSGIPKVGRFEESSLQNDGAGRFTDVTAEKRPNSRRRAWYPRRCGSITTTMASWIWW